VRSLALRLLSTLAAAAPNVNANVLVGYFMARLHSALNECSLSIQFMGANIQRCRLLF
jgi:hypothetical protein